MPNHPVMRKIMTYTAVGGASFWQELVNAWEGFGFRVECIDGISAEEYRLAFRGWRRLRMRLKVYLGYSLKAVCGAWSSCDEKVINIVTTNPFYLPSFVHLFSGNTRTINLIYDLYPDALEVAGIIKRNGFISKILAVNTRYALRHCDATVFLGETLRECAERRYGASRRAVVIPIGADCRGIGAANLSMPRDNKGLRILYCGNMGRMHDYKTLIRAAELGLPPELRIRIHAFGSSYNQLKVELGNFGSSGLILGNPLTPRLWREALKSSEISLITMVSGAETVVMPSKTYSALAAGHAILAICEKKSDLASLIERHDCGWVICPGDYAALRTLLFELSTIPASIRSKRQNAMKAAGLEYNLKLCAERWVEVFDAAEAERGVI